jgi:hypothetical protein
VLLLFNKITKLILHKERIAMWTEDKLNSLLTSPSPALAEDIKKIDGDIIVLGAGGKMGPALCILAKKAAETAGIKKEIIAVSRFTDPFVTELLDSHGIRRISCDLLDRSQLNALPEAENVIFMAGRKFGTEGNESITWAMNATLPAMTAQKYKSSKIVAFSSGNIYPMVKSRSGGCDESVTPSPVGEYAMSCLARERAFEYAADHGAKILLLRLNYAVDLRYGVLYDIADKIKKSIHLTLAVPCFNCIWQGYANEAAIRGLSLAGSPAVKLNITGPETVSVRQTAIKLGEYLGIMPVFSDDEGTDAFINNSSRAMELFGYPSVSLNTLIRWQAEWIADGGRALGKPTHFEEHGGKY